MIAANPVLLGGILSALHVALALGVSAHIVLTKDDVRAAIGWIGLVWLTPILGSGIYLVFGINRINRLPGPMRKGPPLDPADRAVLMRGTSSEPGPSELPADAAPALTAIARIVGKVTQLPLEPRCAIEPLENGDETYPAMLAAIDAAERTIAMATYIFDRGQAGTQFVDALARAVGRGVQVRVLIDGVGARYSHPPIVDELKRRGVPVARFLPAVIPIPQPYINLRNHRKMMIVDGAVAFAGGMNIRDSCLLALRRPDATQDLHFRIRGPVVPQIMQAFAVDWEFTTHEKLPQSTWAPPSASGPVGDTAVRAIPDGPDTDFETLLMVILGAVSAATRSIRIASPYFLPDAPLVDALRVAALRGVEVDIVIPEHGNLRLVQWAMNAQLPQLLAWGCRVYLSRPPFDHSKLLIVDGEWSLIGSANLDPRSLRLNFEFNLECYSRALATHLSSKFDNKIATGRPLTVEDLEHRPLWRRLRDGTAWLAQPYL
ncbi:MAG TPA: cardiolipin synthase [Gemmatimonadaceae bacterium]|nr:cardiolipin synthase [Gemmatimonadaceae bacterium]